MPRKPDADVRVPLARAAEPGSHQARVGQGDRRGMALWEGGRFVDELRMNNARRCRLIRGTSMESVEYAQLSSQHQRSEPSAVHGIKHWAARRDGPRHSRLWKGSPKSRQSSVSGVARGVELLDDLYVLTGQRFDSFRSPLATAFGSTSEPPMPRDRPRPSETRPPFPG